MVLDLKRRLLLLLFAYVIGYFIVSVIAGFAVYKFGIESTPAMRIVTILQDIFIFIMPALVTAIIVTKRPAELLCIDRRIAWMPLALGACVLVVSVPWMNLLINWNQQLPLPGELGETLRGMENNASAMINSLFGPATVPNLIMTILIVGVFAGVSEELFFRGALQRLLTTGGVKAGAAIWVAAIVFSLMHLQFYGFMPRMLLGAFFGYMLLWTRSLWVPIILHALNNTMFIVEQWQTGWNPAAEEAPDADANVLIILGSLALTAIGLYLIYRTCKKEFGPK